MSIRRAHIADILKLERRSVDVHIANSYREIGVRSFGRGLFMKDLSDGAAIADKRVFHVMPGDLVISNVFAWEGAVAVAGSEQQGTIGSHRFMTWTPREKLSVRYLAHYLLSEPGLSQLGGASPGSAGRNRTLSIKNFEALAVPLPTFEEQQRIAAYLDSIGKVWPSARLHRARARSLKARILHAAGGQSRPAVPLSSFLTARSGESVRSDGQYRLSGVYSFGRGLLDRGPIGGTDTKHKSLTPLSVHDVVYSKLGAFEGAVAVVDDAHAGTFVSPEFPVFAILSDVHPKYLHHVLTGTDFEEKLAGASSGVGARQKRVHPTAFVRLTVPLPDRDQQTRLAGVLDRIDAAVALTERTEILASALLPAARNEVFSALR